jgi:hypothetical protein
MSFSMSRHAAICLFITCDIYVAHANFPADNEDGAVDKHLLWSGPRYNVELVARGPALNALIQS